MKGFVWNERTELAVVLLAQGESKVGVAEACGVAKSTIFNWLKVREFAQQVEETKRVMRDQVLQEGIANLVNRVRRYDLRWNQIDQFFRERGADPAHTAYPGWKTGLLCHEQKSIGAGALACIVDMYKVDTATIKEERDLAKQAAQELGQWTEKSETSFDLSGLSDEELETLERIRGKVGA